MVDQNYRPIQCLDLQAESEIPFNLYVNLPLNQKYLLYRRAGGQLESQTLERLSGAQSTHFYIQEKDYEKFVEYVSDRIRQLVGGPETASNQQAMAKLAKSLLSSTLQQTDSAVAQALLANLNEITSVIIEKIFEKSGTGSKKLYQKLSQLAAKGSSYQKHPVNVASLAVLITIGIGYSREKILNDVAMASLLHDLGLSRLLPETIMQAHHIENLELSQRTGIYRHPEMTLEILEEKNIPISELCRTLILQHHEEFNGFGYPSGLRGYTINELAQILRIADEIDQLFLELQTLPGDLKIRTTQLMKRLGEQKVTEPSLLSRVRQVLI